MGEFSEFDRDFGPDEDMFANRWRNGNPREDDYYPRPMGGGGGGKQIQGTLVDLQDGTGDYTGKKVGTILVVVAPCNQSSLIGEEIDVVDWSECVFDLDLADLTGVWVWASKGIALSLDPGAEEGQLTPCHYTADDRCCVEADGGA